MLPAVEIDGEDAADVAAQWIADNEDVWSAWLADPKTEPDRLGKTARKGRLPCHKAPTCVSFDESADLIHSLRALKKCG